MKHKKKTALGLGATLLIALPITAHHEGLRTKAYLDPVGIPTVCYGETDNVSLGDEYSVYQCKEMLTTRLGYFAKRVDALVKVEMTPKYHASLTSFAYNVGVGAFGRSTLLRKLNAGDYEGACDELPKWKYAGGRTWAGLIKRRADERQLCIEGIPDVTST